MDKICIYVEERGKTFQKRKQNKTNELRGDIGTDTCKLVRCLS